MAAQIYKSDFYPAVCCCPNWALALLAALPLMVIALIDARAACKARYKSIAFLA